MAYVQYYQSIAYALVRWSGRSFILSKSASYALFAWLQNPGSIFAMRRILCRGIIAGHPIKKGNDNFLLNPGYVSINVADYQRLIRTLQVKPIFMVHDLIPIKFPEYFSADEELRYHQKIKDILSLASGVTTNSNATLQELAQYAQQTQQPLPTTRATPLSSGLKLMKVSSRPIAKPYFVIVSNIQPHKNHLLLLQIWRNLHQSLGENVPHLFVIGQRGWRCQHIFDLLERCPALKTGVTELSHCSDALLSTYLHHSQALLSPSFTEGFGLPLIEALNYGVPVIASNLPVYREIANNIPEYLEPYDAKGWEAMILDYATPGSIRREAQLQRLQSFKSPTWTEHFKQVDELMMELSQ